MPNNNKVKKEGIAEVNSLMATASADSGGIIRIFSTQSYKDVDQDCFGTCQC